jgi:hypothetical protein
MRSQELLSRANPSTLTYKRARNALHIITQMKATVIREPGGPEVLSIEPWPLGWKKLGLERSFGSRIVTYADDLVILCRQVKAEEALSRLREIMGKLKLMVNEEKTRICKVPEGEFDFLGYTFGRMYSAKTVTGARPGSGPHSRQGFWVQPIRAIYATRVLVSKVARH